MESGSGPLATIEGAIAAVEPPDGEWARRAEERQSRLTMPAGALGRLLEIGRQLAAIQRTDRPEGSPAAVAIFAADHGVAEAGVSAYPQSVTGQMMANFVAGGAAANVLAARCGADVMVADVGVKHPVSGLEGPGHFHRSPIRAGTSSWLDGPAMTREEAVRAVALGLDFARERIAGRYRVVVPGDMGIGNSATAALLIAWLSGRKVAVGRGTGVDDDGLSRKRLVVESALKRHVTDASDLWDGLARMGGLEILALAGLIVGAARERIAVVVDGVISASASLVAARLCPAAVGSMLAGHFSTEPAHRDALEALNLRPILDLELRLGEGSGATLALPIVAASADILRDMATFESAGVDGPA